MRRILITATTILISAATFGQVSNPNVIYVSSAPSGACLATPPIQVVASTGVAYTCDNGTWAAINGGGGGGVTSLTGDGTIISNSGSIGAVTLTLANTPTGTGGVVLATSPTLVTPLLGTPTSGVITNLTGTCTACTANAAATATSATTAVNLSGGGTVTGTPAASVAAIQTNTALFTGATGTTTFPYLMLQPSGATAETGWSTSGTFLGVNSASGFGGNFVDLHVNNAASVLSISSTGLVTTSGGVLQGTAHQFGASGTVALRTGSTGIYTWASSAAFNGTVDTVLDRSAAGVLEINAGTAAGSSGSIKVQAYLTSTNCAGVGTVASPSVVSCSSASAGAFACDVAASAATCTINTTAVTANSEIFVQEVASEGTRLSVTCNTAPTVTPAIVLATKTAGTGFTINMPTITTNPACFVYRILN